jgi:hypothetical protein
MLWRCLDQVARAMMPSERDIIVDITATTVAVSLAGAFFIAFMMGLSAAALPSLLMGIGLGYMTLRLLDARAVAIAVALITLAFTLL